MERTTNPPDSTEVLVVGAGPSGLATACALRQHGIAVRVLDKAAEPATTSRANILFGRGVEVLNRLGALGDLRRQSVAPERLAMYHHGRALVTVPLAAVMSGVGLGQQALYVSQARIEAGLRERFADLGGVVEWNSPLERAEQDSDGVTAYLADGRTVRTSWLVGCDGSHSAVRKAAAIDFPGVPVIEQFLLADVHTDWAHDRSEGAVFLHPDGVLMVIPMRSPDGSDDLWRLMANVPAEAENSLTEADIVDRFHQLLAERADAPDVRIHRATWTSVFRIHRRLADDYRRGRLLLAGDAAHTHSPVGGQGMNTGVGDAENLAWKLALVLRGRADARLLDSYPAERRPLAQEVLRTTTANTKLMVGEDPFRRFLRDRVLLPIGNLRSMQRRNARIASQLAVNYRRGPLARPSLFARGPHAGDRLADLDCVRQDGTPTRLHRELGGHWALLLPTPGSAAATEDELDGCVRAASERLGEFLTVLRTDPGADDSRSKPQAGLSLVRPDAHLAWKGGADPQAIGHWLDAALRYGRVRR